MPRLIAAPFRARSRRTRTLAWATVVVLLGVLAGVGVAMALSRERGGPLRGTEQPGGIAEFGLSVRPGEVADLSVPVKNTSGRPVILDTATLIAAPGKATPRFAGARLATTLDGIGDRGWPPVEPSVRLSGSRIAPGRWTYVYYGIAGMELGANYGASGLVITYHQGHDRYRLRAWGPGVACVRTKLVDDGACDRAGDAIREETEKLAAGD